MKKLLTVVSIFLLLLVVGGCGKKEFTITFNTAGGSKIESVKVKKGETLEEPDEPTRKGYTFVSWQLDGEDFDFETKITKDLTLKAKWKTSSKYTVTFNSNGGSSVDSVKISSGEKVDKPTNPTRTGYTFVRWELNGIEYDFSKGITKDITLVAVWQSNVTTTKNVISQASLTELANLKKEVSALNEVDYTPATWALLKASLNLKEANQTEVNVKINAIKSAKNALETPVDLENAINIRLEALNILKQAYTKGDSTDVSWDALQAEITKVENGIKNSKYIATASNYSFALIEAAANRLETNSNLALAKTAAKNDIDQYVTGLELLSLDYTNPSYIEFTNTVTAIKDEVDTLLWTSLVENFDYQTKINDAVLLLELSELGQSKADKVAEVFIELFAITGIDATRYLQYGDDAEAILNAWESDMRAIYTESTTDALITVIENTVEGILLQVIKTNVENYDLTSLETAIANLETLQELETAIETRIEELYETYVSALTQEDYTEASWEDYMEAVYNKAIDIRTSATVNEAETYDLTSIIVAQSSLELQDNLDQAISNKLAAVTSMTSSVTDEADYSSGYEEYQTALQQAITGINNATTIAEANGYDLTALQIAINNLVRII